MRKFSIKPGLTVAILPGGRVIKRGQKVEGDEFAALVGTFLVELPEEAPAPVVIDPEPVQEVAEVSVESLVETPAATENIEVAPAPPVEPEPAPVVEVPSKPVKPVGKKRAKNK